MKTRYRWKKGEGKKSILNTDIDREDIGRRAGREIEKGAREGEREREHSKV